MTPGLLPLGTAPARSRALSAAANPGDTDVSSQTCPAGPAPAGDFRGADRPAHRALATLRAALALKEADRRQGALQDALALLRQEPPAAFAASLTLLVHGFEDYAECVLRGELGCALPDAGKA